MKAISYNGADEKPRNMAMMREGIGSSGTVISSEKNSVGSAAGPVGYYHEYDEEVKGSNNMGPDGIST